MTYEEFKQNFLPELQNIRSFAGKIRLADQQLQRIGSGTGRAVYDIDGEKALKLAKNPKGIAQNEVESNTGYYRDTQHIVTEVFDSADDDTFLITEKAKKVTKSRIVEVTEIPSLEKLHYFLKNTTSINKGRGKIYDESDITDEETAFFWENEFSSDLINFAGNYAQEVGDWGRPSSYGEVLRDGQPTIVLTDYGLNDEVYNTHYTRSDSNQRNMYELFNYADGNDDILNDTGDQGDIRRGMWAQVPYTVDDGHGVINEKFINFVSNRETYPDKPISGLPELTDSFHECKNNLKEVLNLVEDKEKFYNNLLSLQEYLIRRGFYMGEKLEITEDGSSKFSTSDAVGQDSFPTYNTNDTSPSINNDLDANIAMYEDLIYKHVVGDATDDEYEISEERKKSYMTGSKTVKVKKKCQLGGLPDGTSVACNQGDINNLEFGSVNEEIGLDSDFVDGWNRYGVNNDDVEVGELEVSIRDKFIILNKILIHPDQRQRGYADEVMKILFEYANKNGKIIALTPDNVWGASKEKLKRWYKSLGFVMNTGKNKDFQVRELMIKQPENLEVDEPMNEVVAKTQEEADSFIRDSKVKETVYHGSPVGGIEDFKEPKGGGSDGQVVVSSGLREDAIYFTSNPRLADVYRGKKLNPEFKQEIERQIQVMYDKQMTVRNNRDYDAINDEIEKLRNKLLGEVYGVKLKITNPLIFDGKGKSNSLAGSGWNELEIDLGYKVARGKEAINLIATKSDVAKNYWKYDGIIGKNIIELDSYTNKPDDSNSEYLGNVYAVFSPNQILVLGPELMKDDTPRNDMYFNKLSSVNENDLEVTEYFSSLVPDMNEDIMSIQDLPFKAEVEQLGGKIYSVGGAVRDEFLGKESKDLDILVTGIPMDRLAEMMSRYGKVDAVGQSFGVLKFKPEGASEEIDVAIPRTEVATGAGGHKGFDVSSDHDLPIEKDLERRDFTINAIAKDMDGNLIDPYGGQKDLQNKVIRVVNPEAFSDDPLRMLRAVQFASRFGFTIEPKTAKMIASNASRIKEIPPERILTEFDKIVKKGNKLTGAFLLKDLALTPQIFGTDGAMYLGNEWNNVQTMGEFIWLLGHHLVPDIAEFYRDTLKGDLDTYKEIKALDFAFQADDNADPATARSVAHNMFRISPNSLGSQIIPDVIKHAGEELNTGKYPKTFTELAVNGNDLMDNGLKGKEIGDTLKSLLIKVYADNIRNDKEELLSLVKTSNGAVEEAHAQYSRTAPDTWNVEGETVDIRFFVEMYDKWNKKNGSSKGYFHDPTRDSVLEFLQNSFENFANDVKLAKLLYWELIDRELLNEEEEVKKVRYTCVLLDDKSRASLIKVFHQMIPEGWDIVAHHMTINLGEIDEKYQDLLGKDAKLTVTSYAIDDKVMAVGVKGHPTVNEIPHVTIAVNSKGGGKPYLSNKLRDWKPLNFPLELTGVVTEIT